MPTKHPPSNNNREDFIVRVWRAAQVDTWVAEIHQVSTGQVTHVRNLEELPGCITRQLEARAKLAVPACSEEDEEAAER